LPGSSTRSSRPQASVINIPPTYRPAILAAGLGIAALALSVTTLATRLPSELWTSALLQPRNDDIRQMVVHYSWLPRLITSLLAGAALALVGTVFQQILRNPLASPTTLGVEAGANISLALATLLVPSWLAGGREAIAFAGGLAAVGIVFALSWRRGLDPLIVVLAGLLVGLFFGAIAATLVLLKERHFAGLFLWGNGSLNQQDFSAVTYLLPRLALALTVFIAMIRPLTLLGLDSASAQGLGLRLGIARFAALAVGVGLTASVVSAVGIIGFVGLAVPAVVQLAGARRFHDRLIWSPILGAELLWLADQTVLVLDRIIDSELPTGAFTAFAGAPVLLWLVRSVYLAPGPIQAANYHRHQRVAARPLLLGLFLLLALAAVVSLTFGRGIDGWSWSTGSEFDGLLVWRAPRVVAAMAAGAMLAAAGVLVQRLTGNPMASPEILGASSGAALGLIVALFGIGELGREMALPASLVGVGLSLAAVLALGRRTGFSPDRILLAGIALTAVIDALIGFLTASGDPRAMLLLTWLSGSTYGVDGPTATATAGTAFVLLSAAALLTRWLDILPLGPAVSQSIGVNTRWSRLGILVLTALLTAAGSLVVGTLSFVGLMAPHLARRLGLEQASFHLAGAALLGGLIMVGADWLGRIALFPRQIPAGLVATLVGVPMLMWLVARKA
jgi:iron complex transport system permease protein